MMRSMFSGVSGLRVHQTRMDVIGHNIANVNTVGFKASRALFNEVFSQTLTNATGASDQTGRAGVNAMQVGLGSGVASIDTIMSRGTAQRTDNNFDLMVEGDGFFIVGDATGNFFTRNGSLHIDGDGGLAISNGMRVMGWQITDEWSAGNTTASDRFTVQRGPVQPLQLSPSQFTTGATATTGVSLRGNIQPTIRDNNPLLTTATTPKFFHDSLGNVHQVNVNLQLTDEGNAEYGVWRMTFTVPPGSQLPTQAPVPPATTSNILSNDITGVGASGFMYISFNTSGHLHGVGNTPANAMLETTHADHSTSMNFDFSGVGLVPAATIGNATGQINMNFSELRQLGNASQTVAIDNLNGRPSGTLEDLVIDGNGIVTAIYSNGDRAQLFQIPVAEFPNPAGLESVGGTMFRATANSGDFNNVGVDGRMQSGVLEMSNVDLSAEFTDMIVTQRGFQANSRVISTSDELLVELVNLRR